MAEDLAFPQQGNEDNGAGDPGNKKEPKRRKKIRRGKSTRNALSKFKFLVNNVRGVKSKLTTIKRIIQEEEPVMVALMETKMREGENFQLPGYKIKRVDRDEEGGGVLIAFKETLSDIWICTREYKQHDCEMVWIKMENTKIKIKIGVVYMPQESRTHLEVLKKIYEEIETEIKEAAENGYSLLLTGDFNCKVGDCIKGNTSEVTKGGRIFNSIIKRNKLALGNAQSICEGLWTRIDGLQKSVIDYVVMFEDDLCILEQMEIDESKSSTPYYIETSTNERKYTDHCMIMGSINMKVKETIQPTYVKIMGEKGWSKFRKEIKEKKISELIDERCVKTSYTEWSKAVLKIKNTCSRKAKIRRTWKVNRKLTVEKKEITRELKKITNREQVLLLKRRRKIIIQQIEEEEHKQEYNRIRKIVDEIKQSGGVNSNAFWKARSEICETPGEAAHAIADKHGKLQESPIEIKQVYSEWFQELLKTRNGETAIEKETEEIIQLIWDSMETIAEGQPARKTSAAEVEEIINKLDPKKAKDTCSWKNTIMKEGGEEMIKSIQKIVEKVDEQRVIPDEWQEMHIKATHKKGDKTLMSNKRGLFLTNNVSKVYERIVKERNAESYRAGVSEWANGGLKIRAAIDNVLIITSIIEQNKYLKRNTYLTLTDAEKCFDKLWLQDGVFELWRSGTDIRDCVMVKKLNEKAKIVVRTPVGNTEPFYLEDIVRQGSVYGPQICISSMDRINFVGKDVITYYGPSLPIRAVAFIDDVNGTGGGRVADNLIHNCNIMEERKKMTFNNKNTKTEYMVIGGIDEEPYTVTDKVKNGRIERVAEHKALGTWFDESGEYGINIKKKKEKLQYMITITKNEAHPNNIGVFTIDARLNLGEVVVITSIVYNAEAFHEYKDHEVKELEQVQHTILTGILELPSSTPYYPLLMETGWWTVRGRLVYKKLMLYHNIVTSDEKRVVKKMIKVQKETNRSTTWYGSIRTIIGEFGIEMEAETTMKSRWKKHVKQKINEVMEAEIRGKCYTMSKARTVKEDRYTRKEYLSTTGFHNSKKILKSRMHMSKLPGNYKGNGEGICPLCHEGKGNLEHYFQCRSVRLLVDEWKVTVSDLRSLEIEKMKAVANFIEKVEMMLEPMKILGGKKGKNVK